MTKFPLLLVTASLASVASLAVAQTSALPGQDDMMPPQNQMTQAPPQAPQTMSPQSEQMNGPVANAPAVPMDNSGTVQRYYRTAQVGPGTPDTTAVPSRGTADSYGAPMYGSSHSGAPAATPLIGAPKN